MKPLSPALKACRTRHACALVLLLSLVACSEPPSWGKLLAAKITEHYPSYQVQATPEGGLMVTRPGLPAKPVDVAGIAQFCQRGPKDCGYATDQMLLELGRP